jgi:hypothetical protein
MRATGSALGVLSTTSASYLSFSSPFTDYLPLSRVFTVLLQTQRLKYQLVVFLVHDVIKHFIFPEKQVMLHFKRCGLKKYGKMKCFTTSCTRKTSYVVFQTLQFEKVRGKSTGKLNVL